MMSGKILYAVHEGTYVLKLVGDVRVTLCATLDRFIEGMFCDISMNSVLIDLTEASGIDSTALGLLAKIAVHTQRRFKNRPTIISTNPSITMLLNSMGFDQIFNILHNEDQRCGDLNELPEVVSTERDVCCKVLDAHRTLMQLNKQNESTFKNVVAALEIEAALQDKKVGSGSK